MTIITSLGNIEVADEYLPPNPLEDLELSELDEDFDEGD